jgi:hypothetical protein
MSEPSGEVLRLLQEHPWADTVPRLLHYANSKLKRLRWLCEHSGTPPLGTDAKDVVQTVIEKLLDGRRAWDPTRQPDLVRHIMNIVDSEVNNLATSAENRRTSRTPLDPANESGEPVAEDEPTPEVILLSNEARARGDDYVLGFWSSLETDPELRDVVEAIIDLDDKATPAKIAARLCVPVEDVYGRRKRLQRRLEGYQAEYLAKHPVGSEGHHA